MTAAIENRGLIGDLRTCALVDTDGTIDWWCAPRFDSPALLAGILDDEAGGWRLAPESGLITSRQFYYPGTNVLVTRFHTQSGIAETQDFMPLERAHDPDHRQRIVRRVVGVRGEVPLAMTLSLRPDFGRADPDIEQRSERVVLRNEPSVALTSTHSLDVDGPDIGARFTLGQGEKAQFVLHVLDHPDAEVADECRETEALLQRTVDFWRGWLATSVYSGRWRETVNRSALTLKLLTHEPSGGIIAAPTTSLPEVIGGERNWDYRYVWIRDAAFSVYALLRLGFTDEASAFMAWLSRRMSERPGGADDELGPLRVMYDLDGGIPDDEQRLDHLTGYRESRPVRVGNAAAGQLQLDIYGELIDSAYLFDKNGAGISQDAWRDMTEILGWVLEHWDQPDAGMWEIRDDERRHTTSLLMCWVAAERMIRTARKRGLPGDLVAWARTRDAIHERIMTRCWNEELQAFTQTEDGDTLDAGVLLMPLVKFVAANDPRFLSTLTAIEERLVTDSLVLRYDAERASDGLAGQEGTFSLCSFWYVEALTRAGRIEDAQLALEKMFTYANHLGLYAEEVAFSGEQLGNFPQAFTHLSLISAAINLDDALG